MRDIFDRFKEPDWPHRILRNDTPTGVVQVDSTFQSRKDWFKDPLRLPEPILRMAQAEYDLQYPGQLYERMQQRGGMSVLEVIGFLADHVERLRHENARLWREHERA